MTHRLPILSGFLMTVVAATVLSAPFSVSLVQASQPISKHVLLNGLTVLIKDNPTADLVAVEVLIRAGPRVEEPGEAGISFFTREVALRGTQRRSASEIATALEGVGGTLRAATSADYTELATVSITQYADTALDVLSDLITGAKFDPPDVEAQRRISLSRIRQQADQPLTHVQELAAGEIYAYHPYRNSVLGTADSVSAITRDQLIRYYQTFYTAPNMVVAVAGNLRPAVALAKVQRFFGAIRATPLPQRLRLLHAVEKALAPRPTQAREIREIQQVAAASIAISYLGVEVGHRDWAALSVLNTILGGASSSRLFTEIREKQGLAYAVGSSFPTRAGPGIITMAASTDAVNLTRVVDGMLREAVKLSEAPPSAAELEHAKNRIIGVHAISHEDMRMQAFLPGWYELLGIGYEFDQRIPDLASRVTAEDVQRVARFYLKNPAIAIILPPAR